MSGANPVNTIYFLFTFLGSLRSAVGHLRSQEGRGGMRARCRDDGEVVGRPSGITGQSFLVVDPNRGGSIPRDVSPVEGLLRCHGGWPWS